MVKVAILTGYGINAEKELKWAFDLAGAETEIIHLSDMIESKKKLDLYQILAVPGGFSFGDHIGSGKVFSNMIRLNLFEEIQNFIEKDKLVIGICNGFQIIIKLGLLPKIEVDNKRLVSLVENDSGHFENRWIWVKANKPLSPWLEQIDQLYLPVRHGEGKLIIKDEKTLDFITTHQLDVLHYFNPQALSGEVAYPYNPNGSVLNIAGLTNAKGNVFGLMPHPEAYLFKENHPRWTEGITDDKTGLDIFRNGVNYFR